MKLVVFTDLHHFAADLKTAVFNTKRKLTPYAMPMLAELVDLVNNDLHPDAVVNLGDTIQDNNDPVGDIRALTEVVEKTKEFQVPYYMVLGNHDFKMHDSFEEHKKICGFDSFNYSVDADGYHLVFVTYGISPEYAVAGSSEERARYATKETMDWLRADLEQNTKPCVIFTHFPLIGCEGLSPRHITGNVEELFDLIDNDGKVRAVVSGHTHKAYTRTRNGVDYFVLGSPICSKEENGIPDAVYYVMDLTDETIRLTEHTFQKSLM